MESMKPIILPLFLALLASVIPASAKAAEASGLRTDSFKTSGGEEFLIDLPVGWKSVAQGGASSQDPQIKLTSGEGTSTILVTVLPVQPGARIEGPDDLEKLLLSGVQATSPDGGDRKLNMLTFRSREGFGVYASVMDPRYATQAPPQGRFRFTTTFILNCRERVVTATFLCNEEPFDSVDLAVMVLKTLRPGPSSTAQTASRGAAVSGAK